MIRVTRNDLNYGAPFYKDQIALVQVWINVYLSGLSADRKDMSVLCVTDNRWNFEISVFLSRESRYLNVRERSLRSKKTLAW